jgi:hypothetical protein
MTDDTHLRPLETASSIWPGVVATVGIPLAPLLLGALVHEGRLSLAQTGAAATTEMLGIAVVSAVAGLLLRPRRLRIIAISASTVVCIANLLTPTFSAGAIILLRLVCGCCEGLLLWLTMGCLARAPLPARLTGLYVAAQSLVALVLASGLNAVVLPEHGAIGGYVALAGVAAVTAVVTLGMPSQYQEAARGDALGIPPPWGLVGLAIVFFLLAGLVGLWVYLGPIAARIGRAGSLGSAVTAAIGWKIGGGIAAAWLARRVTWALALLVGIAVLLLVTLSLLIPMTPAPFLAVISLLGFLWMFVSSYLMPMLISVDPTRRAALLLSGSGLIGGAFGPLMGSLVVGPAGAAGPLATAASMMSLALILTASLVFRASHRAPQIPSTFHA